MEVKDIIQRCYPQQMIPADTVIGQMTGKTNGRFDEYKIYYGNIAESLTSKGTYRIPKEEKYMSYLKEFLSNEGAEYKIPTNKEVQDAHIEALNIVQRLKDKAEGINRDAKQEKTDNDNPKKYPASEQEDKQDKSDLPENDSDFDSAEEEKLSDILPIANKRKKMNKGPKSSKKGLGPEIGPSIEDKQVVKQKKVSGGKLFSLILAVLLALSLGVNWKLLQQIKTERQIQYVEMKINDETFQVPLTEIDLEEGESKLMIYGITSSMQNGEIQNKVSIIGNFDFNGFLQEDSVIDENVEKEKENEPEESPANDISESENAEVEEDNSSSGTEDERQEGE